MKESKIRQLLKARVLAYGGEVRAVSWLGRRNAPDVLLLAPNESLLAVRLARNPYAGCTAWVETKRPGKDATAAQAREHERMRDAGCIVVMVRNEQELNEWLPPL